jgi:DNA polymerase-1
LEEAEKFIQQYFRKFTGVFAWISQMRQTAFSSGHIKTSSGRRVFMNPYDKQWQNNAINAPIQGGAADFTKMWVRKYWEGCQSSNIPYTLCLIVHDETGYDTPKEVQKIANKVRKAAFDETAETLFPGIPFKSEAEYGVSWAVKSNPDYQYTDDGE